MPHDMPMNVDWELELRAARVAWEWRYSGVTGYYFPIYLPPLTGSSC